MADGTLIFDTKLDSDGFEEGLNGLKKQASSAGDIMKGFLGADVIKQAGEKLIDFAKDSIMAASDLQEVQNVVDVTFGESANIINDFAKDGAKAFGLTELQTKKYTGTLGALFKSMGLGQDEVTDMSVAMAGLVGDMASFYNLDYDTAFEKLRSGISGETEPLKQLGINMSEVNLEAFALSEGIKTSYKEMTEAEKATLRYNYIMAQTADAQGDFARTSDGFANQLRTLQNNVDSLKTNIGSALLPVVTDVVSALNGLFDGSALTGGKTQLQSEIDAAAESLKGIETNITTLQNDYANTKLKIEIDYANAQQLISDYEKLADVDPNTLTQEELETMKGYVSALRDMYPDLEQYINADTGLFTVEAEQVRTLTEEYKALAEQKAYTQMLEGVYGEYLKANVEYATLGEKAKQAEQEVAALEEQYNALIGLSQTFEGLSLDPFAMTDPAQVQQVADAMQDYIAAFGPLDEGLINRLSEAGINLTTFMDSLQDTSNLDEEGVQNLFATMQEIYNSSELGDNIATVGDQLSAAQEAENSAAQALADGLGVLQTAQSELQTSLSVYEQMTGESASAIVQAIEGSLSEAGKTISTSAGELNAEMAKEIGNSEAIREATVSALSGINPQIDAFTPHAIRVPIEADWSGFSYPSGSTGYSGSRGETNRNGRSVDGSHATGLDYVPYDNYVANLHRGESVLRADDAATWRAAQQSGGSGNLDAVADALSDLAAQPVNVYIDREKVAEAVREPVSYAQNSANRSRALGVGK